MVDLESVGWTLGAVASVMAITTFVALIIKRVHNKKSRENGTPKRSELPKGIISNNLPSLVSMDIVKCLFNSTQVHSFMRILNILMKIV